MWGAQICNPRVGDGKRGVQDKECHRAHWSPSQAASVSSRLGQRPCFKKKGKWAEYGDASFFFKHNIFIKYVRVYNKPKSHPCPSLPMPSPHLCDLLTPKKKKKYIPSPICCCPYAHWSVGKLSVACFKSQHQKQKQVDLYLFEASLVYIVSFRLVWTT